MLLHKLANSLSLPAPTTSQPSLVSNAYNVKRTVQTTEIKYTELCTLLHMIKNTMAATNLSHIPDKERYLHEHFQF